MAAQLEVLDLAGRVVDVILVSNSCGSGEAVWNLECGDGSEAPSGVYVVRLSTGTGEAATRRIVVMR